MEKHFDTTKEYMIYKTSFLAKHVQNGKCVRCGRVATDANMTLTLDHIIPQQLLARMGIDIDRWWDEDNIQVLCRICNGQKGNQLDFTHPKTKELLLKYLSRI